MMNRKKQEEKRKKESKGEEEKTGKKQNEKEGRKESKKEGKRGERRKIGRSRATAATVGGLGGPRKKKKIGLKKFCRAKKTSNRERKERATEIWCPVERSLKKKSKLRVPIR